MKNSIFDELFKEYYSADKVSDLVPNGSFIKFLDSEYGSIEGPDSSGEYWFKGKMFSKETWEAIPQVADFRKKKLIKGILNE